MHANTKRFLDHKRTSATALARAAWVDHYHTRSSFFRFARGVVVQLIPGGISDTFRQMMMLEHLRNRQVLEHDHAKPSNQRSAELMGKIFPPIRNSFMNTANYFSALGAFWRPLFFGTQAPRCPLQVARIAAEEARVRNRFTRAQAGKLFQSNINPNRRFRDIRSRLRFLLSRKTDVPLARAVALAGNGTMKIDRNRAHFRQDYSFAVEPCAVPVVGVRKRIIATNTFETGKTCFCVFRFYAAKERLECQIDTHLNMLQLGTMHRFACLSFGVPVRKEVDRIVKRNRLGRILADLFARGKRLIVHPPTFLKLLLKDVCLPTRQVQTILIRFMQNAHTWITAQNRVAYNPKRHAFARLKAAVF